jgi:hypothetical protein
MTDHERALAALEEMQGRADVAGAGECPEASDAPKLIAALRAVLEMHAPLETSEDDTLCDVCGADHPCPTVRAVAEKLGWNDAK